MIKSIIFKWMIDNKNSTITFIQEIMEGETVTRNIKIEISSHREHGINSVEFRISDETFIMPPSITLCIIALSVLGVTGGILCVRQRRKMDKAFDELQNDFECSETTKKGKND